MSMQKFDIITLAFFTKTEISRERTKINTRKTNLYDLALENMQKKKKLDFFKLHNLVSHYSKQVVPVCYPLTF